MLMIKWSVWLTAQLMINKIQNAPMSFPRIQHEEVLPRHTQERPIFVIVIVVVIRYEILGKQYAYMIIGGQLIIYDWFPTLFVCLFSPCLFVEQCSFSAPCCSEAACMFWILYFLLWQSLCATITSRLVKDFYLGRKLLPSGAFSICLLPCLSW